MLVTFSVYVTTYMLYVCVCVYTLVLMCVHTHAVLHYHILTCSFKMCQPKGKELCDSSLNISKSWDRHCKSVHK